MNPFVTGGEGEAKPKSDVLSLGMAEVNLLKLRSITMEIGDGMALPIALLSGVVSVCLVDSITSAGEEC